MNGEWLDKLPVRKNIRLQGYDYSQSGYYFITICVKDRHETLGNVIVGDGVLDVPRIRLTECGEILRRHITAIDTCYDNLSILKYVIMPNHAHFIVAVHVGGNGTSRTPSPTNAVIPAFISTLKRFTHKDCGFTLFQRAYHDHIIRTEKEYQKIWQYIEENPMKWPEDCYYVEHTDKQFL